MPPPPPRPIRRLILRLAILAVGLALVALAALPTLVGTAAGRRLVLGRINARLAPGRLDVERLDVSWTAPTRLVAFKLIAPDGSRVVDAPLAELDRSLGGILLAGGGPTVLTLDRAALAIRRGGDGKLDLAEAIRGLIAHPDPRRDLTVRIKGGSLAFRAAGLDEPIEARAADLDLHIPAAPQPLTWTLKLGDGEGGELVARGDTNRWTAPDQDPARADLRLDVEARRWPLANEAAGLRMTGRLDGTVELTRRSERWAIESNVQVLDPTLAGDRLDGDTLRPGSVAIVCDLAQQPGWWKIRRLTLDSPLASGRAEGWLGEGRPRGGQGEKRRLEAKADLAALAGQLPRALRLRPGLAVERGQARLVAESAGPLDDSTTTVEATLSDLAARDGDRRVGLRDPATLTAKVVRMGDEVSIRDLTAHTSFLDAAITGRLDDATVAGGVDVGAARQQLGDWFELPAGEAAGRADIAGTYRVRDRRFAGEVRTKAADLRVGRFAVGPADRAALALTVTGPATAAGWPAGWGSAELVADAAGLAARVELQEAGDVVAVGARLAGKLPGAGDGRRVEATLAGSWAASQRQLACDRVVARLVPPPDEREDGRLLLLAAGVVDLAAGSAQFGPLAAAAAAAADPKASVRLAAGPKGTGGLRVAGLGRGLAAMVVDLDLEGDLPAAGGAGNLAASTPDRWSASVQARGQEDGVRFALDSRLDPGDASRAGDPLGQFNVAGQYLATPDRVELTECRVASRFGAATATGQLDDPTGARRFEIRGDVSPDFAAITAWLRAHVEPGALLAGRPRSFQFRGLAGGADPGGTVEGELGFQLDEADVYGMKLGPTPVVVRARGGQILADPISTTLNEGHVRLEPEVVWSDSKGDSVLRLGKNSSIRDARINDEVSRRVLAFVAPILEGATRASGRVSVDVDHAEVPLRPGRSRSALLDGRVVFDDVAFAPGVLANDLLGAIGRRDATLQLDRPVTLTIADGRVNQSGLALPIGDLTRIELAGWVDFDRNIALTATLPVTPAMLGNNPLLADIAAGERVRLPIGGTLNRPSIDQDAFAAGLKDLGKSLLTRGATRGALELFRRLGQPRDDAPAPTTPDERKALRQERRAERKAQRGGTPEANP